MDNIFDKSVKCKQNDNIQLLNQKKSKLIVKEKEKIWKRFLINTLKKTEAVTCQKKLIRNYNTKRRSLIKQNLG